jgi:hypothetical protein
MAAYFERMNAAMSVKNVLGEVKEPVKGHPGVSVIRMKATAQRQGGKARRKNGDGEMSEKDWDKFEKDIEDAFEQVP